MAWMIASDGGDFPLLDHKEEKGRLRIFQSKRDALNALLREDFLPEPGRAEFRVMRVTVVWDNPYGKGRGGPP